MFLLTEIGCPLFLCPLPVHSRQDACLAHLYPVSGFIKQTIYSSISGNHIPDLLHDPFQKATPMVQSDRQVYCIGEVVLDFIFSGGDTAAVRPGGAMLNTSVSLGRCGIPVSLISDLGNDDAGNIILSFLRQNQVNTDSVHRFSEGKTALALAFLDANRNARYSFYKDYPEKRLELPLPNLSANDILLFGSIYAITPGVRGKIVALIKKAKEAGALILYDPNFRKSHLDELHQARPWIEENIAMADIVRGSDEDFRYIFGTIDARETHRHISSLGCRNLIYTSNGTEVEAYVQCGSFQVPVPKIEPVSTVGAGDSFNAGLIAGIMRNSIKVEFLPEIQETVWRDLLNTGILFAQNVCLGLDNYVSPEFAMQYVHE